MRTRRRCRYLCVNMLGRYYVHDVGNFNVEGRRFLYASYVESVPVAVVFGISCFRKVFDGKFEQIALATVYAIKALQLRSLFEVIGDNIGGQVVAIPLIDCA
jgi:hypothetical protein